MAGQRPVVVAATNGDPIKAAQVMRKSKDGSSEPVNCPFLYNNNKHKGGMDHSNQLRGYYHVRLKCRKYYKYIWFLFDVITISFKLCIMTSTFEISRPSLLNWQRDSSESTEAASVLVVLPVVDQSNVSAQHTSLQRRDVLLLLHLRACEASVSLVLQTLQTFPLSQWQRR